jgi:hypothetical protein
MAYLAMLMAQVMVALRRLAYRAGMVKATGHEPIRVVMARDSRLSVSIVLAPAIG